MNNALAIASVTQVLKELLNSGINKELSVAFEENILVNALPPDLINIKDRNHLNLFMYRVSPSTGLKNLGFPSPVGPDTRSSSPRISLDIHYLLTAYGKSELYAELLLGYALKILHEHPFLGQDYIRKSLTQRSLSSSSLSEPIITAFPSEETNQLEHIKISPENLSLENLIGLWTAFKSGYRPSVPYLVSVL
jgi:hypothetical protein